MVNELRQYSQSSFWVEGLNFRSALQFGHLYATDSKNTNSFTRRRFTPYKLSAADHLYIISIGLGPDKYILPYRGIFFNRKIKNSTEIGQEKKKSK